MGSTWGAAKKAWFAGSTTRAALKQPHQSLCSHQFTCHHQLLCGQQTHTIALTVMPTGRQDGPWARRLGAARCTAKDALDRLDVPQHPSHTTALLDLPIGRQVGLWARRLGAARTRVRGAQLHLDAHEQMCGEAL